MAVIVLYSFPPPARSGHKNRIGFLPTSLASPGLELLASALHPHVPYVSKLHRVLGRVWDRGVSDSSACLCRRSWTASRTVCAPNYPGEAGYLDFR